MKRQIPASWQATFWSKSVKNIDLKKDRPYVVHQVLRYGTLPQIKWLFSVYPSSVLKRVFLKQPIKIYSPASLNLAKNFVLKLKRQRINEKKYLGNSLRSAIKRRSKAAT